MLAVQIKDNDMGRACSTHEGEENCIQGIVGGNTKERDHLEDLGVGGSIM
jgi:hypothetical protein